MQKFLNKKHAKGQKHTPHPNLPPHGGKGLKTNTDLCKGTLNFWRLAVLVLLMSAIISCASYVCAQPTDEEVLTLSQIAVLLRASPAEVEYLAKNNLIPSRLIGNEWRFSRAAVLNWLAKQEKPLKADLPAPKLSQVSGRGENNTGSASEPDSTTAEKKKTEVIGEKPDVASAEDVFLRNERVLLKAKELSAEFGLLYSNSQRNVFFTSVERDTFTSSLGLRYGLFDNLQVFASVPYSYQTDTTTSAFTGEQRWDSRNKWGNASLGLRRSIIREGLWKPEVILSIDGQIPIEAGSYGLGGGVSLTKSSDPAVLFANLNYRHAFSRYFADNSLLEPRTVYSVSLGYAYALNDSLTLGAMVSGNFFGRTEFNNNNNSSVILPSQKQFSMRTGLTYLISKSFYLEPTVSFGLNSSAQDVTFGTTLVYTFERVAGNK